MNVKERLEVNCGRMSGTFEVRTAARQKARNTRESGSWKVVPAGPENKQERQGETGWRKGGREKRKS